MEKMKRLYAERNSGGRSEAMIKTFEALYGTASDYLFDFQYNVKAACYEDPSGFVQEDGIDKIIGYRYQGKYVLAHMQDMKLNNNFTEVYNSIKCSEALKLFPGFDKVYGDVENITIVDDEYLHVQFKDGESRQFMFGVKK